MNGGLYSGMLESAIGHVAVPHILPIMEIISLMVRYLDKNFLNLDIGLPVEQLRIQMRQCIVGDTT